MPLLQRFTTTTRFDRPREVSFAHKTIQQPMRWTSGPCLISAAESWQCDPDDLRGLAERAETAGLLVSDGLAACGCCRAWTLAYTEVGLSASLSDIAKQHGIQAARELIGTLTSAEVWDLIAGAWPPMRDIPGMALRSALVSSATQSTDL